MKYISTRDPSIQLTASQAILKGISPEGGLFVPEEFPQVDLDFIRELEGLTYWERAERVMALYLDDFSREDLKACTEGAYRGTFDGDQPAPVRAAGDLRLLELWHGPTCAFKDMALQMLPRLVSTARRNLGDDRRAIVLVATSGDTGKAALEGFRDVDGTGIAVFYPVDGVSQIQRLQMATQQGSNVAVQAVEGNFDDCQTGVKHLFAKEQLAERLGEQKMYLTSANSINWGRLLPQIVYYFSAYADLAASGEIQVGDKLNVAVPTGNFGNILACYYAKRMGLPVGKLICASNRNDVLTDFLRTGIYDRNRPFHTTMSPSMDILISSNLERMLYYLSGKDSVKVAGWMKDLAEQGRYEVDAQTKEKIASLFLSASCDNAQTSAQIRSVYARCGYVMDPHTAVGAHVLEQLKERLDGKVTVLLSTASPYKFTRDVLKALGEAQEGLDDFACMRKLEQLSKQKIPAGLYALKDMPERFADVISCEEMEEYVIAGAREILK